MPNEPKRQEPDIVPPRPNVEPQRTPTEIPQDKDAPERQAPVRAAQPIPSSAGGIWWC